MLAHMMLLEGIREVIPTLAPHGYVVILLLKTKYIIMKKKKQDSLSLKFDKQKIANLTSIKGRSIDYACARGVIGGDGGGNTNTCISKVCCNLEVVK